MKVSLVEEGDYVAYTRYFDDGIGTGREDGSGYILRMVGPVAVVKNGEREFQVPASACKMRAKQYRLDV